MTDSDISNPSWLDKDFLTTVLQENDSLIHINVLSYSAKAAVAAGNNYSGILIRVNVKYERNGELAQKSLIIKIPHQQGEMKDIIEELGVTAKEITIYKDLLPKMDKMTKIKLAPQAYNCQVPGTLILEDLKEQGYVLCDRMKQLDFDHCNMFMKFISTFHALSLQIIKQDPELIAKISEEVLFTVGSNNEIQQYFLKGIDNFASVLQEWEGYEHFAKYYKKGNLLWDRIVELLKGKKHLRVLNHGDVWTSNMLFKHDNTGKVIDMKLIDFQVCRLASPAMDLVLFLISSAQEDVKQHRLPELYSTYLDNLNSTLKSIGCEERLTWEEFQDELKFVEEFPLIFIPAQLAIVLCENQNLIRAGELLGSTKSTEESSEQYHKILNGKYFVNVAKFELKKTRSTRSSCIMLNKYFDAFISSVGIQ